MTFLSWSGVSWSASWWTCAGDERRGRRVYHTALARVVTVFGAAHPHHAYLFANKRANRVKVVVHDGIGIWLAPRQLHQGQFFWLAANEVH